MKEELFSESLSVKEMAYKNIKYQIVSGKIKPGVWLREEELSKMMNISRPPIREALNLLEREGFVRLFPRRGVIVTQITEKEIEDIYQLREVLELFLIKEYFNEISKEKIIKLKNEFKKILDEEIFGENFRMQYLNLSKEFHEAIHENCKNEKIVDIIKNNLEKIHWFRAFSRVRKSFKDSILENLGIIEAIENGDKELAVKRMKEHYIKAKKSLIKEINTILQNTNDIVPKFYKSKINWK